MTRRILFITGTRADFGKLEPLAVAARDAGFAVSFFVTGMHLMERYGRTKLEVARFPDAEMFEFQNQREGDPQDMILAKTVVGFSDFLTEHRPDLAVVHGDRIEAPARAPACATNCVRCAHIAGAELAGTTDEICPQSNSKLATHHFVSSDDAARRVMSLGEPPESIHVIGSPELDFHSRSSGVSIDEVRKHYEIPFPDFGIVTFHPVTSEAATMGAQAEALFGTLAGSGKAFVGIAPNNDPGSEAIFRVLETLPKDRFRILPSMRFAHFSELMKNAACMIGNSSAGVREAPFLGLPSLDIGTRQTNRGSAPSIASAKAFDREAILSFLASEWGKPHDSHTAFGEGCAADRFVAVLKDPAFWERGLQKQFSDLG